MLRYLGGRLLQMGGAFVLVAFAIYGLEPALRPEQYPGQAWWPLVSHDVERALLHLDFGNACQWPRCPPVREFWVDGLAGDLYTLGGAVLFAVFGGVGAAAWCAGRPKALRSRVIQATATFVFCAPVYVVGLGLLLAFDPDLSDHGLPLFFQARPERFTQIWDDPWDWLQSYLVPCLVLAGPLAGAAFRVTFRLTVDELGSDHVRTAIAKGLTRRRVMRRHAAPVAHLATASVVWGQIPTLVFNLALVEYVFNVPGMFKHLRRAMGMGRETVGQIAMPDVPMIQGLALWAAFLIIVLSLAADAALAAIDPKLREG